ncbi:hypothetical protein PanWU01x14_268110 [Parasponia andersonii]|uniref:Uncharacterized protein n=1 Tax=Parasponia andersonii TaxID=3476 RepID=A0A2P5B686_PARAD|nr:hypothetical protein PanWU01x14_268110 [Parasponia andersonii]
MALSTWLGYLCVLPNTIAPAPYSYDHIRRIDRTHPPENWGLVARGEIPLDNMSFLTNEQFLLFPFQNLLVMVAFGFGTAILKL